MSVNYLNSWNWIFMMSGAPLMYTIFSPVFSHDCVQNPQVPLSFFYTHLSLGFILALSANITPDRKLNTQCLLEPLKCLLILRYPAPSLIVVQFHCPFKGSPRETVVKFILRLSVQCKPVWAYLLGVKEPTLSVSTDSTFWLQMWLVNWTSKENKSTQQYFIHQGNLQWITASLWLSLVLI